MKAFGATPNNAAFTSLLKYNPVTLQSIAYAQNQFLLRSKFSVDPANPYFYVFSNSAIDLGDTNAALKTVATFTNGGVPVSNMEFYWGDTASLDANLSSPVVNLQVGGSGSGFIIGNDPIAGTCGYTTPGTQGFGQVLRWTSICDSIEVVTTWLFAATFVPTNSATQLPSDFSGNVSIIHGIQQQPW